MDGAKLFWNYSVCFADDRDGDDDDDDGRQSEVTNAPKNVVMG